jgi:hypothetical protein
MTDWQVTSITIYCDAVDDDVTIMVYKDWITTCTGYKKYGEILNKETAKLLKRKAKRLGRNLGCEGPLDHRVTEYRDRLMSQDKTAPIQTKVTKKKRALH